MTTPETLINCGIDNAPCALCRALGALPAPRPPEPVCADCGVVCVDDVHDYASTRFAHAFTTARPPEPDRTAALVEAVHQAINAVPAMHVIDTAYVPQAKRRPNAVVDRHAVIVAARDAIRAALAATPEPAPVADGTVEPVCGHKRYRGDLPCGATASDDWHKRSTWEQDPDLYHPFTPTPPTEATK